MKLSAQKVGFSLGLTLAIYYFILTLIAHYNGYGAEFLGMFEGFGYDISVQGAFIGAVYGFIDGAIFGSVFTYIYNNCPWTK